MTGKRFLALIDTYCCCGYWSFGELTGGGHAPGFAVQYCSKECEGNLYEYCGSADKNYLSIYTADQIAATSVIGTYTSRTSTYTSA